jgi:uncharacterized protein YjbI with pentapeptide repeats
LVGFLISVVIKEFELLTRVAIPTLLIGLGWIFAGLRLKSNQGGWDKRSFLAMVTGIGTLLIIGGTASFIRIYPSTCMNRIGTEENLSYCNFSGLDLSEVNFSGSNLSRVTFIESNLQHADLTNTNLSWAGFWKADLTDAVLRGATLRSAGLKGSTLVRTDFTNADLTDANMRYVDLTDSTMIGSSLQGADLYLSDLQRVDFTNADLSGASLFDADLQDAILIQANLSGADLRSANISGVILDGAILDGVDPSSIDGLTAEMGSRASSWEMPGLEAFQTVCSGNGIQVARGYNPGSNFHSTIVTSINEENWNNPFPNWEPSDLRALELVACDRGEEEVYLICTYAIDEVISIYQYQWSVTLKDAKTGETIASQKFKGEGLDSCPQNFPEAQVPRGEHVDPQDVLDWLEGYVYPP